jgi:protein-tyrosine-phosphatase/predicted ATP-grasp superfamily ATP-dependent carboligase
MTMVQKPRVLVLDGDMVPSLTIARSLSRRQCEIDVASHSARPLTSYSATVRSYFQYPDPLASGDRFVEWLLTHVDAHHYDLVIPVTERILVPLSRCRDRFRHVKIAMPAAHSLEIVLDKSQTLALAAKVGVPGPRGVSVGSLDELEDIKQSVKFPVVLKPARSIGTAEGGASQMQVSYAFDMTELEAGCAHALRFGPIILQEYFSGVGVGIELIARQGEIAYSFQHLRLHEVPLSGGGSSLRKSVPVVPRLLEASEKLISALEWNGVAMVEFKLNPQTGEFCLMEINGRFWGSLPLAEAAGADFPSMLLDLELSGDIRPSRPYRNDVYCRLLTRDLYWYEAVLREDADTRVVTLPRGWEVFKELGLFLNFRHRFDVQSVRDPVPGLIDIGRILSAYLQRIQALFEEMQFRAQQKRAWNRGEVSAALSRAESMLFLCYGNINRSALADVMVRAYAEDSGIAVASAGFHPEEGRPADPVMVDVAAQFNLEMSNTRSACVTEQQLHDSDIIFVMEKSHYDKLVAIDDSLAGKVYLLGAHNGDATQSVEIQDPYGRAREVYQACYNQIVEAVDHIKGVIAIEIGDWR